MSAVNLSMKGNSFGLTKYTSDDDSLYCSFEQAGEHDTLGFVRFASSHPVKWIILIYSIHICIVRLKTYNK